MMGRGRTLDTVAGVAPGAGAWHWAWLSGNARHCLYADGAKVVSGVLDTRHNVFPVPVSRPKSGHLQNINPCLFTPALATSHQHRETFSMHKGHNIFNIVSSNVTLFDFSILVNCIKS